MEQISRKALKEQYKNRTIVGGIYCITCSGDSKSWIRATTDMQGAKNRFAFSVSVNSCPETGMLSAWNQFGASAFSFKVLEEMKKKELQTDCEFLQDVNTLLEMWTEKSGEEGGR